MVGQPWFYNDLWFFSDNPICRSVMAEQEPPPPAKFDDDHWEETPAAGVHLER